MKKFLVRYGKRCLVEISELMEVKVLSCDQGATTNLPRAQVVYFLVIYEPFGRYHIVTEAHDEEKLNALRDKILEAYSRGEKEIYLEPV
jgi:hypothetical protein